MCEEVKFELEELHEMEAKNGRKFDYVRLSTCDLNGTSRTNAVPRRHLEKTLVNGIFNFVGNEVYNIEIEIK